MGIKDLNSTPFFTKHYETHQADILQKIRKRKGLIKKIAQDDIQTNTGFDGDTFSVKGETDAALSPSDSEYEDSFPASQSIPEYGLFL